jgi:hypothetical protein
MMTWAYGLAGAAALAVAGFLGWAASLPPEATARRSALIAAPVERVFALAADVSGPAAWRRDVARVEVAPGGAEWVEHTRQGLAIAFREGRKEPGLYAIAFASPQGFAGALGRPLGSGGRGDPGRGGRDGPDRGPDRPRDGAAVRAGRRPCGPMAGGPRRRRGARRAAQETDGDGEIMDREARGPEAASTARPLRTDGPGRRRPPSADARAYP